MKFGTIKPAEAALLKARWWRSAKRELIAWAVCFALGWVIFAEALLSFHWPSWGYWAIAGGSLLLFSRLAIWVTLFCAVAAHVLLGVTGHSVVITFQIFCACIYAIILRSPVTLIALFFLRSTVPMSRRQSWMEGETETPEYDCVRDENIYRDGRREPAYLQPKHKTEWPYGDENNRNGY
jgi:hypothetical protein